MTFKHLPLIALLIAGCTTEPVSTPVAAPLAAREPSSTSAENPNRFGDVAYHDAEKTNFEVGDLHTKTFSVDTREDRLEFRVKLEATLARNSEKMPEEAETALTEAIRLLKEMDHETATASEFRRLHETIDAYNLNFQSPIPRKIWIGEIPYEAIKMIHHSIMNKRAPEATDLAVTSTLDSSIVDPKPSSFWKPGRAIAQVDKYHGIDRPLMPEISAPCKYLKPKKSYGTHGGFTMECDGGAKWKVKFGNESKTEPFNSRLVWALGYHATPIDYLPAGVRLQYDRKVLSEYASRKDLKIEVQAAPGLTLFSKSIQKVLNPFEDGVLGAELVDGTRVSAEKLQAKLVKSMPSKKGKPDWSKIKDMQVNEDFEKKIKYLVLREASLEGPSPENEKELGEWSWKSFDHADRRELRAFGLITAWVNAFDMRANNNKTLLKTNPDGSTELIQEVSDLGSGFGDARNILHYANFNLNALPWDLVRYRASDSSARDDRDDDSQEDVEAGDVAAGDWASPFKFMHYSVIESNKAFSRAQIDDAKWIIRKLASFSEDQLHDALVAAGFTSAEARLTLEKLLDRRQQLVDTFGLAKEFPDLMDRRINRSITYNPAKDGEVVTKIGDLKISARPSKQRLVKGQLFSY